MRRVFVKDASINFIARFRRDLCCYAPHLLPRLAMAAPPPAAVLLLSALAPLNATMPLSVAISLRRRPECALIFFGSRLSWAACAKYKPQTQPIAGKPCKKTHELLDPLEDPRKHRITPVSSVVLHSDWGQAWCSCCTEFGGHAGRDQKYRVRIGIMISDDCGAYKRTYHNRTKSLQILIKIKKKNFIDVMQLKTV